jgi:urea carboxylase
MVEREKQIEVPKYLRPRTDTPKLTVGHGGCFGCIYSVRGAGGYQLFGVTPMPIYDPKQEVSYLRDFMILFKPGDIVKFKPVDRDGYDEAIELVNAGRFEPTIRPVKFSLDEFHANPPATSRKVLGALHGA